MRRHQKSKSNFIKISKDWLVPHRGNRHHPHLVRLHGLSLCLGLIILFQLLFNLTTSGHAQVLGYATDINVSDLFTLTNQQRANNGQPGLHLNSKLNQAAAAKASDMFKKDYWAHVSPDGVQPWAFITAAGYHYVYAGENLAKDFDTSSGVVAGWMASGEHKANILNVHYHDVGFAVENGVLVGGETTLVVAFYASPQPVSSPTVAGLQPSQPKLTSASQALASQSTKTSASHVKPAANQPSVEAAKTDQTISYSPSGQMVSESAPGLEQFHIYSEPMLYLKNLRWSDYATIGMLGTLTAVNGLRHLALAKQRRRRGRYLYHPLWQAGLTTFGIFLIVTSGLGVIQ